MLCRQHYPRRSRLLLSLLLLLLTNPLSIRATDFRLCLPSNRGDPEAPSISDSCRSSNNTPLTDGRGGGGNTQCRVKCDSFDNPAFSVENIDVDCDFCALNASIPFRTVAFDFKTFTLCIPRGVCIQQCGQEVAGCVYTGTCTSQTCFKSTATGEPAELSRITYAGSGSYITAGSVSTERGNLSPLPPFEFSNFDACLDSSETIVFGTTTESCRSSDPLHDGIEEGGTEKQCRVACEVFDDPEYEVVHYWTFCSFCQMSTADKYILQDLKHVCIPREVCADECGEPVRGCAYTGSCESQFCFSGIDSKSPAKISWGTNGTGNDVTITVDNRARPTTVDPPVFAASKLSIDSGPRQSTKPTTPTANPTTSRTTNPTAIPTKTPTATRTSTPTSNQAPSPSPDGGKPTPTTTPRITETSTPTPNTLRSPFPLGEVLGGIIGAIGAIIASIIATAFVKRRINAGSGGDIQNGDAEVAAGTIIL